jgi:hypothetical protein
VGPMCDTTSRNAKLSSLLRELARSGSPVDLSVTLTQVEKVEIEQVGGIHDSKIFELEDGRVACMTDIVVTNQTSTAIHIVDVQLRTSSNDWSWEWLVPRQTKSQGHAKRDRGYVTYCFPGKCGLELEYDLVINDVLLGNRPLPSRRPVEGFLLGIGGLMPAKLRHGQWLQFILTLIGSDHREYAATIQLGVERLHARPKIVKPETNPYAEALGEEAKRLLRVTPTEPWPAPQNGSWSDPTGISLNHDTERRSQPPAAKDN